MSKLKAKILVVDDNAGIRSTLKLVLPAHFSEVETIASPKELMSKMGSFKPDVVLLDMNFETDINTGNEGLFWLSELKRSFADTEVVLFTAYADIALAVEGMKRGAFDFIVKPWENDKLLGVLEAACRKHKAEPQAKTSAQEMPMLWGNSSAVNEVHRMVEKIAPTDASVLITGENGTGKDVLANEIHRLSARSGKDMVSVDIGSLTETLFESELFGHVKGAFTDARTDHTGKFEQANGTTLFLDEIGNIPLNLQAKLLRVLQNRSITKVGDTRSIPIDIRLICATNRDLALMVQQGVFREDLLYRINTIHLHLPALRERKEDILPLAERFLQQYNIQYGRGLETISTEAAKKLQACPWYGNIRELQHTIEKDVIMAEGKVLKPEHIELNALIQPSSIQDSQQTQTLEAT